MVRTARQLQLLLVALVGLASCIPVTVAAPYDDLLIGYLRQRSDENGMRIGWTVQDADGADKGGDGTADITGVTYTTNSQGLTRQGPHVFTSDPLPFELHFDPNRYILANLYLWNQGQKCEAPTLRAELRAGQTLVASSTESSRLSVQVAPDGVCHLGIALIPEVASIDSQAILEMRILVLKQTTSFQYLFTEEVPSRLELPYLSWNELARRDPSAAQRLASATNASPGSQPISALWVAGLLAIPGRRSRAGAAVLVLIVAGCVGPPDREQAGTAPENEIGGSVRTEFQPEPAGASASGNGSILGRIIDDLGLAVPKAHVSLLETNRFADSDRWGQFTILGIPAGTYTIRVVEAARIENKPAEFKIFVDRVEVRSALGTILEVQLEPLVERPPAYRRHLHDDWAGRTTMTMLDGPVALASPTAAGAVVPLPVLNPLGGSNVVLPGTARIEARLSWTDPSIASVMFQFTDNNLNGRNTDLRNRGFTTPESWNAGIGGPTFTPRPSGATVVVLCTWEMTDLGHQEETGWKFGFRLIRAEQSPADSAVPGSSTPEVHVTLTLHRGGALPVGLPHPDTFNATGEVGLSKFNNVSVAPSTLPNRVWQWHWEKPDSLPTVPADADWVEFTLRMSRSTAPSLDWRLFVRDASPGAGSCAQHSTLRLAPDPVVNDEKNQWRWRLPLGDGDFLPDSPYASQTRWCFVTAADPDAWREVCIRDKICKFDWWLPTNSGCSATEFALENCAIRELGTAGVYVFPRVDERPLTLNATVVAGVDRVVKA